MSEEKKDDEPESSEISNEEDKEKNDFISISSEEENNQNNISNNNYDNSKILGNKRMASKDLKDQRDYNDSRKKIKKYNNYDNSYNDKKSFQPSLDIPLITFDLYCELYIEKEGKDKKEEELKKMYEEYKVNHEQKNNEQFFNYHINDEWFLEKYNPYKFTEFNVKERNEMCQRKAKIFIDENPIEQIIKIEKTDINREEDNSVQKKNYIFDLKEEHEYNKNIKLFYTKVNVSENKIEEIERDLNNIPLNKDIIQKELGEEGKPYYFFNPDYLTLYNCSSLTKKVDIIPILNTFKKYPGFVSLSLTDPERINFYKRSFWVTYDNESNYQNALHSLKEYDLKDFTIRVNKSETSPNVYFKRIKVTPPLFEERLNEDIIGSNKIISILDKYREIINNPLIEKIDINEISSKNEEDRIKILNLNILYLRKIHGFCYYCLKGFRDERNLTKKGDYLHLRHYTKLGHRDTLENLMNKEDLNMNEEEIKNAIEFDKFFNNKLNELLNDKEKINCDILLRPKYLMEDEFALNKIEEEQNKFIIKNSERFDEEKYECKICTKKFLAFRYIENHMKNKHSNAMEDYANTNVSEFLMKENFKEDKEKFSKSNIINNREDYEEFLNKKDSYKNPYYEHLFYRKYKDWDDPSNFQSSKSSTLKISYDDL